jgi:hypothetical protein
MPTLGTIVVYITDRGDARAAIVSSVQEGGLILSVFLNPGDDQFANGPILVVQNVPNDPTGATPNSYH